MITTAIITAIRMQIHTETPIKHLVIIFNENRSFDHYFATYPNATNPTGASQLPAEAAYTARSRTSRMPTCC